MKKGKYLSLFTVMLLLVPYIFILAGVNAKADEIYQYQDKRFIATEEVDISYKYTVNQKKIVFIGKLNLPKMRFKMKQNWESKWWMWMTI